MKFLTDITRFYTLVTTYACGLKSQHLKTSPNKPRLRRTTQGMAVSCSECLSLCAFETRTHTLLIRREIQQETWHYLSLLGHMWHTGSCRSELLSLSTDRAPQAGGSTWQGSKYGNHLVKKGGGRLDHRELLSAVKHCQAFSWEAGSLWVTVKPGF